MERIVIDYKPRSFFLEHLHNRTEKFKVLVFHRRSGKTMAAVNQLIKDACITKNSLFAYIAPNYRMAKRIAWDYIKKFTSVIPGIMFNESELSVVFPNKSKIYLLGAEGYDSLRGIGLWGCIFDEYQDIPEKAFTEVIINTLVDHNGYAIFLGTPRGKENHLNTYYNKTGKDWYCASMNCFDTKVLSDEQIQMVKDNVSEAEFRQEMLCEFLEGSDSTYFTNIDNITILPGLSRSTDSNYVIGVDLGKKQDFTVISVMDRNTNRLVDFDRFQLSWAVVKERIAKMALQYNNAHVVIDSTGLGDPILEDLKNDNIDIEGFTFTRTSKRNLMNKLSNYISQSKISIPNIPELISELKRFGYFDMESLEGHDDAVCSLALAVWSLSEVKVDTSDFGWFNKQKSNNNIYATI